MRRMAVRILCAELCGPPGIRFVYDCLPKEQRIEFLGSFHTFSGYRYKKLPVGDSGVENVLYQLIGNGLHQLGLHLRKNLG